MPYGSRPHHLTDRRRGRGFAAAGDGGDDIDLDGGSGCEVLEEKIQIIRAAGELRRRVDAHAFQKHAVVSGAAGVGPFGEFAAGAGGGDREAADGFRRARIGGNIQPEEGLRASRFWP